MIHQTYSDYTQVVINGKAMLRVGSAIEWAAFIKAGYTIDSALRPVKGNKASVPLTLLVPELGRYVATIRDESLDLDSPLTEDELAEYCTNHANYFQGRKSAAIA